MSPICAVDGVVGRAPGGMVGICGAIKTSGSECGSPYSCKHKLPDLHLNLKGEYFDQIKAGTKTEEYREITDYWKKRLEGRSYGRVIIKKGYPKAGDNDRTLVCKWNGHTTKEITHPHFGDDPVNVFAIDVSQEVKPCS